MKPLALETARVVTVSIAAIVFSEIALAAEKAAPVLEVGPAVYQPTLPAKTAPKASDLVLRGPGLPAAARHELGELTVSERALLSAPDPRGGSARSKRARNGITRDVSPQVGFTGLSVNLAAGSSGEMGGGLLEKLADGSLAWTAEFSSSGAGALRLYVAQARLPQGSRVYVYGDDGEIKGPYDFAAGTRPEGFWTNTIYSGSISIEARIPAGSGAGLGTATLRVGGVVHIVKSGTSTLRPKDDSCFVDRSCVTVADWVNIDQASNAVAQLTFTDQGGSFICSGGLMNTASGPTAPYLLTANHCFDNQASATSLEATWQYRTATCNGPTPDESLFPTTLGSTLLATGKASTSSDYTFLQLSEDPPANSVALGWTTADLVDTSGLVGYRLSYPLSADQFTVVPQIYTREQLVAVTGGESCESQGVSPSRFLYETDIQGATGGGSSGSPLMLSDLRVIGQEYGSCGSNTADDCDTVNNDTVDGAFSVTFPALKQWLQPAAPGVCTPNATTLCLGEARFRITAFYSTSQGQSGAGMAVSLTSDSGYFWFFSADNIELIVKVLDGCAINSEHWVFASGLTNVNVTMIVEDTATGASQTYLNPQGQAYEPLQDTSAFSCP